MTTPEAALQPAASPSPTRIGLLLGYIAGTSGLGIAGAPIVSRDVAADLGLATAQTAWVIALFTLSLGVMTLLFGRLADLRGGRFVILVAAGWAVAGTAVVLLAPTLPVLLVGRALQGGAAAGMSIVAFAVPAHLLEPAGRARALGVLTALAALTLGAGPLLGAAAAEAAGWRAALTLSALMLLAVPALIRLAPPPLAGSAGTLDLPGAGLAATAGIGGSVLLQARATHLSAAAVVAVGALTAVSATALTRHVRRTPEGFLPLVVVRNRAVIRLSLAAAAIMAGFLAMGFLAPLLLTQDGERSPLTVGALLLPAAAAAAATAQVVGVIRVTVPAERIVAALGLLSASGLVIAGLGATTPALVVLGAAAATSGFAGAQVALLDRVSELVPAADRGIAIGVFNLLFVAGGATGAALAGGLVDVVALGTATAMCGVLVAASMPLAVSAARAGVDFSAQCNTPSTRRHSGG